MSQLEQIAAGVRAFADEADGPLAAAHQLDAAVRRLNDSASALAGAERGQICGALAGASASARSSIDALDSFRAGAVAFADRLVNGGGGMSHGSGVNGRASMEANEARAVLVADADSDAGTVSAPVDPPLLDGYTFEPSDSRPLFGADGIDGSVPLQGQLGDCFFIASVAAVAASEPATVQKLFSGEHGSEDILVKGERVSNSLPRSSSGQEDLGSSSDRSTWVGLLEKQYAAHVGGYEVLNEGGLPVDVLAWLTGREGHANRVDSMSDQALRTLSNSTSPSVAGSIAAASTPETIRDLMDQYRVFEGHAYIVDSVDKDGQMHLRNPWGFDHPRPIPLDDFRQLFDWIDYA